MLYKTTAHDLQKIKRKARPNERRTIEATWCLKKMQYSLKLRQINEFATKGLITLWTGKRIAGRCHRGF